MRHDYDIFEKYPDGSIVWRVGVSSRYEAQRKILELAENTTNQLYAVNRITKDILPSILERSKVAHG